MKSRYTLVSLNLWNTEHLDERRECLVSFLKTYRADIFCFQEIRTELCDLFDSTLPDYHRVEGPEPGWKNEGTIYYNKELFSEEAHGRVDLEMPEKDRGLFWVRLRTADGKRLLAMTVHFTHQLNADENRTGMPYRPREARRVVEALKELEENDGVILAGDFNDPVQPVHILHEEGGMEDAFRILGVPSPVTFPCIYLSEEDWQVEAIDKILVKNGVRPLVACSPRYHIPGGVLSDHWPVMTCFEY